MDKRNMLYFGAVVLIMILTLAVSVLAGGEDSEARELLAEYGWEVSEKPIEKADIIIPDPFDRVYESYNELQLKAELDLRPYRGRRGVRYTYIVKNYPRDVGEEVRANVICIDGKPVGGDIMTVSLYGFMHSLNFSDARMY